MAGITRFNITDSIQGDGAWRFTESQRYRGVANALYRQIFSELGMPLLEGEETFDCSLIEFQAGYDYALGIDVILRTVEGVENTLQEKYLFTTFNTLTIEHCQDWLSLEPGDWYKLKAQYYFCGYDPNKELNLNPWMLVDYPRLQRATAQHRIKWQLNSNMKDGARASFMSVPFNKVPPECCVASSEVSYSLW